MAKDLLKRVLQNEMKQDILFQWLSFNEEVLLYNLLSNS